MEHAPLDAWTPQSQCVHARPEHDVKKASMARQDATEGFRGFSPVPQIMEEIMDDTQLVPRRRIRNILCSHSQAEGSEGRRDDGSFSVV